MSRMQYYADMITRRRLPAAEQAHRTTRDSWQRLTAIFAGGTVDLSRSDDATRVAMIFAGLAITYYHVWSHRMDSRNKKIYMYMGSGSQPELD